MHAIRLLVSVRLCPYAASLFVLLVCSSACQEPRAQKRPNATDIKVGQLRGYTLQRKPHDHQAHVSGDLALESPKLAVDVRVSGQSDTHGALVAVRQPDGSHDWESLRPMIALNGALLTPRVEHVGLARVGDRPAVVVDAVVEDEQRTMSMRRVFRIADVHNALRISTQLRLVRGSLPLELQVVERVAFGGGSPSAPLFGQLAAESAIETDWIARAAQNEAIVLASLSGALRVVGHAGDHGRTDQITVSDAWLPTQKTGTGRYSAEAVLIASQSGLAQAVRALGWVRNKPFVEALALLDSDPPDALIEVVESSSGKLVISAVPDDNRRAILPLPEAALAERLSVGARAGGAAASEQLPLVGPPYEPVSLTIPESSTLSVAVRHAASGEPLPARVRVVPLRGTLPLKLGPDWSAKGAIDTLIVAAGRAEIRLPSGYYRVLVTHGPEWTIVDKSIELGVAKRVQVDAELERAIDPGSWVPCELHVHQEPSADSHVTLEDRVASLVAEGIAFAVPTDHNHVTDLSAAVASQPLWGLTTVPGVEVTTDEPIFGHFNAYPYPLAQGMLGQGAPEHRGLTPAELFSSLHTVDPDLIVQVNHPRIEGGIGYFEVAGFDAARDRGNSMWSHDFDALEVWNGFDLARWENVERVFSDWLLMIERGHRIVATGSSDSHTVRSEGAGYPRTYVRAPLAGVPQGKQLVRALREGRAFVTSGPFLTARIGTAGIGDSVPLDSKTVDLDVFVQIPAWMQLSSLRVYLGSRLLRSASLGPPSATSSAGKRYRKTIRLPVEGPGPLVVAVEGPATLEPVIARRGVRPFAFTNPIWLTRPAADLQPSSPAQSAPSLAPLAEDAGTAADAATLLDEARL